MEYTVVRSGSDGALTSDVNELIAEGWEPQGGVAIEVEVSGDEDSTSSSSWFYQAMIRRNN